MQGKLILAIAILALLVPAAYCWEITYTFDTDHNWGYFDNDTGPRTSVSPSGGVLSVDYPDYDFVSIRYIFFDQDTVNPVFGANVDLSQEAYVRAKLSYSGSQAPTFAYFFFAGGGDAGDDQIYLTGQPGSWQGGTQTFWAASSDPLQLTNELAWTSTYYFTPDTFKRLTVGPEHTSQMGDPDTWAASISSVDAIGIVLGYVGTPPADATLNIDEFTVTPEPSILLLSGPLAGFLGWRIRRRSRKRTAKA
jgi:hypothetical protein